MRTNATYLCGSQFLLLSNTPPKCPRQECVLQSSMPRAGQNHTYDASDMSAYGIFGRETTEYTVMHGVYIRLWPTLLV
jgi:hypothetical protein